MEGKVLVVPFTELLIEGDLTFCSKCLHLLFNPRIVYLSATKHLRLHQVCYDLIQSVPLTALLLVNTTTKRKIDG